MSATIDNATGKVIDLALAVHTYDSANTIRTESGQLIIAGFKGLDFAAFGVQQSAIIAQLVSAKLSDNAEAAKRMMQRTLENLGIEKPKAPGASAEKQVKREAVKLEASKLVESAGITAETSAEEILQKAGKVTGAQQAALVQAAVVKSKAASKAESVAFTARKAALSKAMKACVDNAKVEKGCKLFGVK
jgi:hypothetical protein